MPFKILKYFLLICLGLILIGVFVAIPFMIKAKNEGERLYAMYDSYTKKMLTENFALNPYPIKAEFQKIQPWKALKLFKVVAKNQEGKLFKRVTNLDASIAIFMKMYTCLILPNYHYNLPMLSVDIIFIGGRRVFAIEIIDPARIEDQNLTIYYEKMRTWKPEVDKLEKMEIDMEWSKDIVTDFSIHAQADRTKDELLYEIYKDYLNTYIAMAKNAKALSPELSEKVQEGMEGYVDTLMAKGGPAVNVFKTLLGAEKQEEYVRTVMFGVGS
jgi:15,16-dihydrobiliverdin:ferredoxin oxidoreductase